MRVEIKHNNDTIQLNIEDNATIRDLKYALMGLQQEEFILVHKGRTLEKELNTLIKDITNEKDPSAIIIVSFPKIREVEVPCNDDYYLDSYYEESIQEQERYETPAEFSAEDDSSRMQNVSSLQQENPKLYQRLSTNEFEFSDTVLDGLIDLVFQKKVVM